MESLQSTTKIDFIETRPTLYFNKYNYRMRLFCKRANLSYWAKNKQDVLDKIETYPKHNKDANVDAIVKLIDWKRESKQANEKECTIRIEGDIVAIFSNNLEYLKQFEDFGCEFNYTQVDNKIPGGTRYFKQEPKTKYRLYLKSRKVSETFKAELSKFIERYKGTETIVIPSKSLSHWLDDNGPYVRGSWSYYRNNFYTSSHYFIGYNDESMQTIFSLMFSGMIYKTFKLEKQPDTE